ncbi:MAG: NAD(P)/FAD-dependent oxidoreductase [Candidatus Izemoplasmatales bacterium]|nr:NAD(P)/FAD-dependent oxidoreductase [bacterium]MDZ4196164.1 NAD(P)/FAD-dependent oxidoreductase [Candidatus Izemoplasmatales bacterium]
MNESIVIIGGGASGLMAAIIAARNHGQVTILERNNRIGKKILATGNGRCNFTNAFASSIHYNHPDFVDSVLKQHSAIDTISFFESLGIAHKIEEEGKTYPLSDQASSMVDVLLYEVTRLKIDVRTEAKVVQIKKEKVGFTVILHDGQKIYASKVIVSTGGKAMPSSGSDGSGYALLQSLGHHSTTIFPALTKLTLDCPYLKHLDGVKIPGTVQLLSTNQVVQEESGDILFTSYGISGPPILELSRRANELLLLGTKVEIKVILVTHLTKEEVALRFEQSLDKPIDFSLVGLINKRLISPLLKDSGIANQTAKVSTLSKAQLFTLLSKLFDWRFVVTGSKGFEDAQVTAGGIMMSEVNKDTLESLLVKGLYITGEVLDIDGLCGGYNLQWAWSSGYVAGLHASKG